MWLNASNRGSIVQLLANFNSLHQYEWFESFFYDDKTFFFMRLFFYIMQRWNTLKITLILAVYLKENSPFPVVFSLTVSFP